LSFCVNGSKFGPQQYYRDDEQARRVLKTCRENPVLITGLRRIGKSWFLRRFEQILAARSTRHFTKEGAPSDRPLEPGMPRAVAILDGGAEDLGAALSAILSRADPDLILAVDELEKLVADASKANLLDRILAYRPLVLTAAPVIHELARARVPRLASFFEEQSVPMVLKPLSSSEKRALVLQTCDPGEGVPDNLVAMALWWDWGGHPLVLQQVGALLRDGHASDATTLISLAHARLNLGGPRYGLSLSGETGLSRAHRAVLARVAAGQVPGDDHLAALLQDHGAVVRRKSGWAIENCVLRRHLQGASEAIDPPDPPKPARRSAAPVQVFNWIHLSDLHFGAGKEERRLDRKRVTRAIELDIRRKAPKSVDRIFVTGDIAFSARREEYEQAKGWFEEVARAAGVSVERLRLVPGNHDIDRQLAQKPLSRCAHRAVREKWADLDDLLADTDARAALGEKLAAYRSFVEGGLFGHPRPLDNGIDWMETIPEVAGARGPIRIAGLSTVWVSDADDGNREDPFVPNLSLGLGPLDHACGRASEGELVFVLTHHPPSWLLDAGAQALDRALARIPHVHLCGHVHRADASQQKRFGRAGRSVRYVAGAAHGDASEEYGYAWGAVRWDPSASSWQMGWGPRTYEPSRDEMRVDSTRHDLDADGFAWETIECSWPAPG
jgi:hypothetical protein